MSGAVIQLLDSILAAAVLSILSSVSDGGFLQRELDTREAPRTACMGPESIEAYTQNFWSGNARDVGGPGASLLRLMVWRAGTTSYCYSM